MRPEWNLGRVSQTCSTTQLSRGKNVVAKSQRHTTTRSGIVPNDCCSPLPAINSHFTMQSKGTTTTVARIVRRVRRYKSRAALDSVGQNHNGEALAVRHRSQIIGNSHDSCLRHMVFTCVLSVKVNTAWKRHRTCHAIAREFPESRHHGANTQL